GRRARGGGTRGAQDGAPPRRRGGLQRVDDRRSAAPPEVPGPSGRQGSSRGSSGDTHMTAKHAESLTLGGIQVTLSHTDKVLFPDDKITKGDLIEYYAQVTDWMLPYLRDRPAAMARYPEGITGQPTSPKNTPH